MNHVLVTGGAGFIGGHLVDRLLLEGRQVTVVDSFDPSYNRSANKADIERHRTSSGYELVEADIRDLEALRHRLDGGYDVIVHLAARSGCRASVQDPITCQEVNVGGTHNLLELARQWGTKQFVFSSSSSVYGVNPRLPWREEDTVLLPVSPFAGSKAAGELLGHVYSHLFDIRFVALRLFSVYGPRQRPDGAIHQFARRMLTGEPIDLYGKGHTRRDYTYVGDAVDGIRAAMDYGDLSYEVINLGSGSSLSLCELVASLEQVLNVDAAIESLPVQPGDLPQTWAHIGKAQRLLGYHPRTSLQQGLASFAAWLGGEPDRNLLALQEAIHDSTRQVEVPLQGR